ncbi:MAG: DNA-binding protein [Burkholderiaceae bacterium]|nr:DNA-binding protein [Burkholderiaceae bacterium]
MQVKSTRGVQQDEVWAAADALIAEGQRPTIERVRQRLGRGSPNTVSPMLEAWFGTLGKRLGVTELQNDLKRIPPIVSQSISKIWEVALHEAHIEAGQNVAKVNEALALERAELDERDAKLAQRDLVLNERELASNEALELANRQFSELSTRFTDLQNQLQQRESEFLELRGELSSLQSSRQSDSRKHEEAVKLLNRERQQLEERNDLNHRRLLQDLDRSRQDVKQVKTAADEFERRSENARKEFDAVNVALSDKLKLSQIEVATLSQALTTANDRSTELRGLLDEQRIANASSLHELNELFLKNTEASKKLPTKKKPSRI